MSYTLEAAATATGLNQARILQAIEEGTIAATRDEGGEWLVEAAELQRLHASALADADGDAAPPAQREIEALGAEIEILLRQAGARLRQQLDELHRARGDAPLALAGGEDRPQ